MFDRLKIETFGIDILCKFDGCMNMKCGFKKRHVILQSTPALVACIFATT